MWGHRLRRVLVRNRLNDSPVELHRAVIHIRCSISCRDRVYRIRVIGSRDNLRVLVDPWSRNASVWRLNPSTGELSKLRDGPDLRDQPYQECIQY